MKKNEKEVRLLDQQIDQLVNDPELQSVISDVMMYSEDYDIDLNDTTAEISNWF
ncbi:hypothetical protein [uncultured Aquimarina sp.]|uniref:hypothetical protein n=1 Tax=uncultured Aquimarina sp. TaxID=575652 RepID=UPI00262A95E7|nr:hypothetical protein [uncultured Aquimarina sp.]